MIESVVFFILGFLCAGLLALMVAPAFWRRAVNLTRRRIEASVPLTLNEIQAGRDSLRAEFAMATRRLEMEVKSLREKRAAEAEMVGRSREDMRRLSVEREAARTASSTLEADCVALKQSLRERDEKLRVETERLAEVTAALDARTAEMKQLNSLYDEATYVSSDRQITLVGRESENERLTDELARATRDRLELERRAREAESERKTVLDTLALERKRLAALEAKNAQMLATIADRDELLDRRQKETERNRQTRQAKPDGDVSIVSEPSEPDVITLEDRRRLEHRLTTLTRENRRLRTASLTQGLTDATAAESDPNALLRDRISQLAAEVVNMTVLLEGDDSPVARAAGGPASKPAADAAGKPMTSLADRIRTLRQAASERSD